MTIAETDAIFARAYASAIKKKLQLEVGEDKVLFLSPLVQRGIPAGSLIPPEITNFEVYTFGDTLLTADNPSYFGGGGNPSYIQDLRTYVDYIYTKIDWSPGVTQHMAEARKAVADAEDAYSAAFDKAMTAWKKAHDSGISTKQFWPWTRESAPYLDSAEELRKQAYTSLDAAAMQHYGPQAATLADIRAGLRDALETDPEKKYPGYNQAGVTADIDLMVEATKRAEGGEKISESTIHNYIVQVPDYSIRGYNIAMNEWMRLASQASPKRNQVLTINVKEGKETSWEDYGYKDVRDSGSAGIFPFFSAADGQTQKKFILETQGKETEISFTISAIGMKLFPVTAGRWDVANVKNRFPQLVDGAPDVLNSKYARPMSVLVGYDIALTVTFGHSIRKEAKELYETAKNSGGSLKIFGFEVGGAGGGGFSDHVDTSFKGVEWDDASGSITLIPASQQVYPVVLAVIGQRLVSTKPEGPRVSEVFGPKIGSGVGNVIQGFDFLNVDVKDSTKDDYLHVGLAPAYGTLTSETIKTMDEHLKVMIAGTMRLLEKKRKEKGGPLSWDEVMSVLMQNTLIEPDDSKAGSKIDRADKLIKPSVLNFFKISGAPDPTVVKEVQTWFTKFIGDQDILDSTKINIKVMAEIVAQTGATIDSVEAVIHKIEHHEKTLVDIGVLRFPDPEHPYFKVYRIKLTAWSVSARYLAWQEDSSGITGELNVRHFQPRKSVMDKMRKEVLDKAVKESEDIFS